MSVRLALAAVIVFLCLGGGGAILMWQRQQLLRQQVAVQRERALALTARARAASEQPPARDTEAVPEESPGRADQPESIEAALGGILELQQQAWNAGDIDTFMEHYWKSDDLTFSSGGKVTRSWQSTLENYKERYPTRSAMGTLAFKNLEVTPLGADAALVLGEWQLNRESDQLRGNFTLIFRRLGGKWVIVHDHTSRLSQ